MLRPYDGEQMFAGLARCMLEIAYVRAVGKLDKGVDAYAEDPVVRHLARLAAEWQQRWVQAERERLAAESRWVNSLIPSIN